MISDIKKYKREYREKNREKICLYDREWRQRNKDKVKKSNKKWYIKKGKEYSMQYSKTDKVRLDRTMRRSIWTALKEKKAGRKWEDLAGYTLGDLMIHLESLFDEKMNWENYGSYWWIDHIEPKSLFYYTSSDDLEFKECWALNNLQPLEKILNIKKGNKRSYNKYNKI